MAYDYTDGLNSFKRNLIEIPIYTSENAQSQRSFLFTTSKHTNLKIEKSEHVLGFISIYL